MGDLVVVCLALAGTVVSGFSAKKIDFVRDVQPIFARSCLACHGPNTQMAGLRLDAKQAVFAKVVLPGNAAESALYRRVAGIGDVARMPMGGRLADDQIATLKAWIEQGAEWPDSDRVQAQHECGVRERVGQTDRSVADAGFGGVETDEDLAGNGR